MDQERPTLVTVAGIGYAIAGGIALVGAAYVAFIGFVIGALGGAAASQGGWWGWAGAIGGAIAFFLMLAAIVLIGLGIFVLMTGLHILKGRPWARTGGIVAGVLMVLTGMLSLADVGAAMGGILIGAAGVLGIVALSQPDASAWFAAKSDASVPARTA